MRTVLLEGSQVEDELVCALSVTSLEQHRIALEARGGGIMNICMCVGCEWGENECERGCFEV